MKLFFDGCIIKQFDSDGNITLSLTGADLDNFYPLLLKQIFEKENFPVDITLNYPRLQLKRIECEKCGGLTDFITSISKHDMESHDALVKILKRKQVDLKCKECGEPIE